MGFIKLVQRKECLRLTITGKFALLILFALFFYLFFNWIPGFLSLNKPKQGNILVLDGQMPDYAIVEAIRIYDSCNYNLIIATGGNLTTGFYISGKKSMPEVTRATFIELGFNPEKIIAVSAGNVTRNRTYSSGLSLKKWFTTHNIKTEKIDILAIGCHSRRSQMLFSRALGENFQVGVISVPDNSYSAKKWWKSSKGARTVISETIAFGYTRFFNTQ